MQTALDSVILCNDRWLKTQVTTWQSISAVPTGGNSEQVRRTDRIPVFMCYKLIGAFVYFLYPQGVELQPQDPSGLVSSANSGNWRSHSSAFIIAFRLSFRTSFFS